MLKNHKQYESSNTLVLAPLYFYNVIAECQKDTNEIIGSEKKLVYSDIHIVTQVVRNCNKREFI